MNTVGSRVLLLNAYSALNRGDGLLAELAIELCREALGADTRICLAAPDPDSFGALSVHAISPFGSTKSVIVALRAALVFVSGGRFGFSMPFTLAANECDILVSVGGGYLRGGRKLELAKCLLVHGSQALLASRLAKSKPWVLLPQSVGPFDGFAKRWLHRRLATAARVFLRDDKSIAELAGLGNLERVSDCAVLQVGSSPHRLRGSEVQATAVIPPSTGLILRQLPSPGNYEDELTCLIAGRGDWMPILQSRRGTNDDTLFYSRIGLPASKSLTEAVKAGSIASCVSVRLHGAIESILLGVPAVHLSYERKGFAAFHDLGLARFVFDARGFDHQEVLDRLSELEADSRSYWTAIQASAPRLVAERERVTKVIQLSREGLFSSCY